MEPSKRGEFVPVLDTLDGTKLDDWAISLLDLLEFLRVFFGNLSPELNNMLHDNLFDLLQELRLLQGFAGNIQGKVVG